MLVLGVTGHRPSEYGGFSASNPIRNRLVEETRKALITLEPNKVITGMAVGFDQIIAELCIELNIPFIAAIPFIGQEKIWPEAGKKHYKYLLKQASEKQIISSGEYAPWKMQIRNQWIVDNSDKMLACFNGKSFGGTFNCVQYAKQKNKEIIVINPSKF